MKDRRWPTRTVSPPEGRTPDGAYPSGAAAKPWMFILGGCLTVALLAAFMVMLRLLWPPDHDAGLALDGDRPLRTLSRQLERAGNPYKATREEQEVSKAGARANSRSATPVAQYHSRRGEPPPPVAQYHSRPGEPPPPVAQHHSRRGGPPTPVAQYHRPRFEPTSAAPSTRLEKAASTVPVRRAGDPPISEVQMP